MAVWNFKTLNGHSCVIKQATAINFTPLDSSRQRTSFQIKFFGKFAKKYIFLIFEDFWLKRSCLARGIQRCQIHRSKSLNNGVMAVWNFKTLNGHSCVIKQATAINFTPLDSSRQRASFQINFFGKFAKKYIFLIFEDFWLKRSCLARGIQRCQIHRSKSLNNGVMAVWNFKILNGHSSVIKQATAINFTPLDSSRQRASFQIKFFGKFAKKEAAWREESNGAKFIALSRLITELWPFEISKL
jgi:spore coat protein U-like protein